MQDELQKLKEHFITHLVKFVGMLLRPRLHRRIVSSGWHSVELLLIWELFSMTISYYHHVYRTSCVC